MRSTSFWHTPEIPKSNNDDDTAHLELLSTCINDVLVSTASRTIHPYIMDDFEEWVSLHFGDSHLVHSKLGDSRFQLKKYDPNRTPKKSGTSRPSRKGVSKKALI